MRPIYVEYLEDGGRFPQRQAHSMNANGERPDGHRRSLALPTRKSRRLECLCEQVSELHSHNRFDLLASQISTSQCLGGSCSTKLRLTGFFVLYNKTNLQHFPSIHGVRSAPRVIKNHPSLVQIARFLLLIRSQWNNGLSTVLQRPQRIFRSIVFVY